jgi:hypothetical protein
MSVLELTAMGGGARAAERRGGASICAEAPDEVPAGSRAEGPHPGAAPGGARGLLVDRIRDVTRLRHLSRRTEAAYLHWIRRYFRFHGGQHPAALGAEDVTAFLSSLATDGGVAASQHARDLAGAAGWVELPGALARKFPKAGREWLWQWVFPATRTYLHDRAAAAPSPARERSAAGRAPRRAGRAPDQAGDVPLLAAFVRDAPARGWLRHPHGAGAARAQRCRDHNDLHARAQPRTGSGAEPGRSVAGAMSGKVKAWKR